MDCVDIGLLSEGENSEDSRRVDMLELLGGCAVDCGYPTPRRKSWWQKWRATVRVFLDIAPEAPRGW